MAETRTIESAINNATTAIKQLGRAQEYNSLDRKHELLVESALYRLSNALNVLLSEGRPKEN